ALTIASRKVLAPRTAVYHDGRGSDPMIDVGSVFPAEALNIFLGPLDHSVQWANVDMHQQPRFSNGGAGAARLGPLHLNEQISAGMGRGVSLVPESAITPSAGATLSNSLQLGLQQSFDIRQPLEATDKVWPKVNWRSSKQFFRQRDNMKVIVEVGAASAMLGEACHARMTLAILANASEVTPSRISEEDVGAKVDGLSKPLEAP